MYPDCRRRPPWTASKRISLAGRAASSRSRCSNHRSRSSGSRSDLTGPNLPEPLGRDIVLAAVALVRVLVVVIGAVVRVRVRVLGSVVMGVRMRMIVGVPRERIVVSVHGPVVVFVRHVLRHGVTSALTMLVASPRGLLGGAAYSAASRQNSSTKRAVRRKSEMMIFATIEQKLADFFARDKARRCQAAA
jgi:hypothetical protein